MSLSLSIGILGQVWYLIVLIPDLCTLTYFDLKSIFLKISFRNIIRASNSLDSDQARRYVGPDLGPNYLQKLSAADTWR